MRSIAIVLLFVTVLAAAQTPLEVTWGDEAHTLTLTTGDTTVTFPQAMLEGDFPAPGQAPTFDPTKAWPIVTYRSRWALDLSTWPEAQRAAALDYILMRGCDTAAYPGVYPDAVLSTRVTSAPTLSPNGTSLAAKLCGKTFDYEMMTKGGAGAPDALIKTALTTGVSEDGMTVYYADQSSSIDESLDSRIVVFVAHRDGDKVLFELRGEYIAKDRVLLRATVLDRIESTAKYLGDQMTNYMTAPPTAAEIARRAALVPQPVEGATGEGDVTDPEATPATALFDADPNAAPLEKRKRFDWKLPVIAGAVCGVLLAVTIRLRRRKKAS